jgi:two-component system invasion response regulator UvrY
MSGFAEKQYAINVLRAGASGYLAKDQAPEEFLRAVHTILAGRRFVSTTLSEMLVSALDEPTDQPLHAALSEREFQILCKIAVGRSVSEIAKELFWVAILCDAHEIGYRRRTGISTRHVE